MLIPRHFKLPLIAAVVTLLLLVGCGKKGPLYLPDGSSPPKQLQPKH
jgi:predicted small lipoprotein YifL